MCYEVTIHNKPKIQQTNSQRESIFLYRYRAHETNESYLARQRRGEASAIEVLARARANVNAKDKYGFSPLHYSALRGNHSETVELLSCDNIDIEVRI